MDLSDNKSAYDDEMDRLSNSQFGESKPYKQSGISQGPRSIPDLNRSNASSNDLSEANRR